MFYAAAVSCLLLGSSLCNAASDDSVEWVQRRRASREQPKRIFITGRLGRSIESSGVAALDQEALALVRRADPFPPPPAEIGSDQLQFIVPVVFTGVRPSAVLSTDGTTSGRALDTKLYGTAAAADLPGGNKPAAKKPARSCRVRRLLVQSR
jgi:hypothetical protein